MLTTSQGETGNDTISAPEPDAENGPVQVGFYQVIGLEALPQETFIPIAVIMMREPEFFGDIQMARIRLLGKQMLSRSGVRASGHRNSALQICNIAYNGLKEDHGKHCRVC